MASAAVQLPALPGPPGQPDIGYSPDHKKYLDRTQRRRDTENLNGSLPPGFPRQLNSDLVWDGTSLASKYDWNYRLSEADLGEIEAALKHFKCKTGFVFSVLSIRLSGCHLRLPGKQN